VTPVGLPHLQHLFVAMGTWHVQSALGVLSQPMQEPLGVVTRAIMVIACYVLWNVGYIMMMIQGYRERSYGMPTVGSAAILGICIVALYGPFSDQSHLFYYKKNYATLSVWIISLVLQCGVYAQCLYYGRSHARLLPEFRMHFYAVTIGLLVTMTITFWTFIVYYQDYYVNEICPIAVLIMSAAYFGTLYSQPDMRGLSATVAWMIAVGDLLLYSAVVLGDITDPFPDAAFGYAFIYWIYSLTLVLNFAYAILATRRRLRLRAQLA
jgi:hypothetical protein